MSVLGPAQPLTKTGTRDIVPGNYHRPQCPGDTHIPTACPNEHGASHLWSKSGTLPNVVTFILLLKSLFLWVKSHSFPIQASTGYVYLYIYINIYKYCTRTINHTSILSIWKYSEFLIMTKHDWSIPSLEVTCLLGVVIILDSPLKAIDVDP